MDGSDDLLLEELHESQVRDVVRMLERCDEERRATSWFRLGRRLRLSRGRRGWQRRHRQLTGRAYISIRRLRTLRAVGVVGLGIAVGATALAVTRPAAEPEAPRPGPVLLPPTAEESGKPGEVSFPDLRREDRRLYTRFDAEAKFRARGVAVRMEACRRHELAFTSCIPPLDETPENVQVVGVTSDMYIVTANSHSGNSFSIERNVTGALRTCGAPGDAGCPRSGHW